MMPRRRSRVPSFTPLCLFIIEYLSPLLPRCLYLRIYAFSDNALLSVDINYRTYLPALRGVVIVVHVFSDHPLCCHLPFAAAFALRRRQRKMYSGPIHHTCRQWAVYDERIVDGVKTEV